jgi:hypothetical protein
MAKPARLPTGCLCSITAAVIERLSKCQERGKKRRLDCRIVTPIGFLHPEFHSLCPAGANGSPVETPFLSCVLSGWRGRRFARYMPTALGGHLFYNRRVRAGSVFYEPQLSPKLTLTITRRSSLGSRVWTQWLTDRQPVQLRLSV